MSLSAGIKVPNNWDDRPKSLEAMAAMMTSRGNVLKISSTDERNFDSQTVRKLTCAEKNGVVVGGDELHLPVARFVVGADGDVYVTNTHYGRVEWETNAKAVAEEAGLL